MAPFLLDDAPGSYGSGSGDGQGRSSSCAGHVARRLAPPARLGASSRGVTNPIVITGSASGLGAALVSSLSAAGLPCIGVDLRDATVIADLGTTEGRAHAVAECERLADGRLDGVVSCAAASPIHPDPAVVVSVNWFGAMAVLDGLLPSLTRGDTPAAVAISSIGAVDGSADDSLVDVLLAGDEARGREIAADGTDFRSAIAYAAAKRAVALGVRARTAIWAEAGVRINAVAPGRMETPMLDGLLADPVIAEGIGLLPVGIQASASPHQIAEVVRFLLGRASSFVHGQVLYVDGGTEALIRPSLV
jgi:3alpha-hydroxysteroid 3-dehydrogenase